MKFTLKQWRAVKGYSQAEMAERLSVNINTFAAWERDQENVTVKNLKRIAEVLEITVDDLIDK